MNGDQLRELYGKYKDKPEFKALLETISYAEGTPGQSGYQTMFTGKKFNDFSRHPDTVNRSGRYASTAAGKYQFLTPTWNSIQNQLKLPDFSPDSQNKAALHLIRNRFGGGLAEVEQKLQQGDFRSIFDKLSPTWASLPTTGGTSYYGQPVKPLSTLQSKYSENLSKTSGSTPPVNPPASTQQGTAPSSSPGVNINIIADPDTLKALGITTTTTESSTDLLDPAKMAQNLLNQTIAGLMTNQEYSNPWDLDREAA